MGCLSRGIVKFRFKGDTVRENCRTCFSFTSLSSSGHNAALYRGVFDKDLRNEEEDVLVTCSHQTKKVNASK